MWSHINDNLGATYVCNANDVKPSGDEVPNGAILFEMDTAVFYMYDADGEVWHPIP